jgi:tetratricopeptide (TPR) repeat protein
MRRLGILMLIAFLLFSCAKKKGETEKVLSQEEAGRTAALAFPVWRTTLAVLFPDDFSPGESILFQEYSDDLTSRLSRAGGVRILLWPADAFFRDSGPGADYLLIGDVKLHGSSADWTFALQKAAADSMVWNFKKTAPASGVYAVSRETAVRFAQTVGLDTVRIGGERTAPIPTDLYDAYLAGLSCLREMKKEKMDCAVRSFKQVLKADSTFLPAWLRLADCYLSIFQNRWDTNRVWIQLAQDAAFRAARLDSVGGDARFLLGRVYVQWGDLRAAEREFRAALRLNPNLPDAWTWMGDLVSSTGGPYELGLETYGRALELSPYTPKAAVGKAVFLMGLRRYAEAERTLENALHFNSADPLLHTMLSLSMYYQKNMKSALDEIEKGMRIETGRPISHAVLAMIQASSGEPDKALGEVTLQVEPYAGSNASLCTAIAAVYSLLGRKGLSIQWLERAVSLGYMDFVWLSNDPNFDGVRKDPRFAALMEKIKRERTRGPA